MKKIFIIAAAACVTLASCVKNEPVAAPEFGDEISFESPVLAPNTKVAEVVDFDQKSFKVWAYLTAGDFAGSIGTDAWIPGIQMNDVGDVWKNESDPYYWPKSGKLQVSAVYPSEESTASVTDNGVQFDDYTVETDLSNQVDLMFSNRVYNVVKANPVVSIPLVFNHALTAINFTVTASEGPEFVLTGITLTGVKTTGDFNQGLAYSAENKTPQVQTAAAGSCWNLDAATGNYSVTIKGTELEVPNSSVYVHNGLADRGTESSLMLLPQSVDGIDVVLNYTLDGIAQSTSFELTGSWLRGTRYTYAISFGADEITFDASATAWEGGSATPPTTTIQ